MSETTNTPGQDDDEGTFVGGSFGEPPTEDPATTAERLEAHEAAGPELAGGVEDVPAGPELAGGVEDVPAEPSPGERNEPV